MINYKEFKEQEIYSYKEVNNGHNIKMDFFNIFKFYCAYYNLFRTKVDTEKTLKKLHNYIEIIDPTFKAIEEINGFTMDKESNITIKYIDEKESKKTIALSMELIGEKI